MQNICSTERPQKKSTELKLALLKNWLKKDEQFKMWELYIKDVQIQVHRKIFLLMYFTWNWNFCNQKKNKMFFYSYL